MSHPGPGERPILYRRRLIPDECVRLDDDEIIFMDEDIIVTKWKALHPKPRLDHGYSCYFLKKNYKVSKFLFSDDTLIYWYCDIIDHNYDESTNSYTFRDLLADVIVFPDGFVKVVDLDEFEEALDKGLLESSDVKGALRSLDSLLRTIYDGRFDELKNEIESRI
jgi:predicted RNA-binding protein associated with RNAse of E/G family